MKLVVRFAIYRPVILTICLITSLIALFLPCFSYYEDPETSVKYYSDISIRQWAIIVGVSQYECYNLDTRYADNDARDLYTRIAQYYLEDHIKLLLNSEATKPEIQSVICSWLASRISIDDSVLVFFACHGNCNYLQMSNSIQGNSNDDIAPSELVSWLDTLKTENVCLIMDVCESGCYCQNIQKNGYTLITGGTGNEKCWQEAKYKHGILSYYLIEAFNHFEDVNGNNDNEISAQELFYYIQAKMTTEFQSYPPPSPQHPQIMNYHIGEFLLFVLPTH